MNKQLQCNFIKFNFHPRTLSAHIFYPIILVLIFLAHSSFTWAGGVEPTNEELLKEIRALKARVTDLERKLVSQEKTTAKVEKDVKETKEWIRYTPGKGIEIEPAGLNIGANATFVMQGTPNANNAGANEDSIFDASWSGGISIEKEFGDWGKAYMELEPGQGDSIEGELNLLSNVNQDAGDTGNSPDIAKAWYEHYFFDKQLVLVAGKVDPGDARDGSEYACDECTQFVGRMFKHSPSIEFPSDNNLGMHLTMCLEPIDFAEATFGYFEGDGDWENVFDHNVYTFQVNLKPAGPLGLDEEQWGGNYRFYSWINDQFHTKLVGQGDLESDEVKEINYGFGMSFDQAITDVFGIFGRFGCQRPDLMMLDGSGTVEAAWSTGLQMTGKYWRRDDDVLAFGFGQALPSKEYKDAGNGGAGEGHFELYYNYRVNEHLSLTPDMQVIWNPNGVNHGYQGDEDAIFVYGLRTQVDF